MREASGIPNYGDHQLGIYLRGLAGERESLALTFADLEARAAGAMSTELLAYVAGGAARASSSAKVSGRLSRSPASPRR